MALIRFCRHHTTMGKENCCYCSVLVGFRKRFEGKQRKTAPVIIELYECVQHKSEFDKVRNDKDLYKMRTISVCDMCTCFKWI